MDKILIVYNKDKDPTGEILERTKKAILNNFDHDESFIETCEVRDFKENHTKNYCFIITIGGDGTVLDTMHSISGFNVPVIGINVGRVGFLADIELQKIESGIMKLSVGGYTLEKHSYIEGFIPNSQERGIAVNDITIGKNNFLSTIQLELRVNGVIVNEYICDGINISTAVGSTAYNRSLGGPIICPGLQVFSIKPIGTSDNMFDSLIVDDASIIEVKVTRCHKGEHCVVGFDSRNVLPLNEGDSIMVRKSSKNYSLLHLREYNYFKTLKNKKNIS